MNSTISKVDLFRIWQEDESLDFEWLISRMRGDEADTDVQKAGLAFHKVMESAVVGDFEDLTADGYRFEFAKDFNVDITRIRELSVTKSYGDLALHGRVDGLYGNTVIDYKTTSQFDADRYMSSYLWRFYLDIMKAEVFRWIVFVIKELDDPKDYLVTDVHVLEQRRYPGLESDCENLARNYANFMKHYGRKIYAPKPTLQEQLEQSLAMVKEKKAMA